MKDLNILVRLPNWLGDVVMAAPFLHALHTAYPAAQVSVVVKKGLDPLLSLFPPRAHQFVFDKTAYKGAAGAWRFGREIKKTVSFDLFFCLPDSFSSALMGRAGGAKKRIGYKGEGRSILFTHSFPKPQGLHRADAYLHLLQTFSNTHIPAPVLQLRHAQSKQDYLVVNINSEASSRRLTEAKAVELLTMLEKKVSQKIVLIGAPKEMPFVHGVLKKLPPNRFENQCGKTTLPQLVELLAAARLLLTTDSGPAHLANALGTHTIVLFGAGNEKETAPYNASLRTIIRLNHLSCEPCEKNKCLRFETPQCLERLDSAFIVTQVVHHLNNPSA